MMRKYFQSYTAFAFLLGLLFLMPKSFTEKIREYTARGGAMLYPRQAKGTVEEELEHMKLENLLLSKQIQGVREYLVLEEKIEKRFKELELLRQSKEESTQDKEFFIRKEEKLLQRLKHYTKSIPAQVIYRDPAFWSQIVWIDVGKKDNEELGEEVILHNSPVVIGDVLVGVIDYVGRDQSRVRMITDPTVCVAVRILRGAEQNIQLVGDLNKLMEQLKFRGDLFFSLEEQTNTLEILGHLQDNLRGEVGDRYLAKGELCGSVAPTWRRRSTTLKGIGFNYDFADEEGPARELHAVESKEVLLQEGDLLVTTGMDGIFPEGLHVAIVEKVAPLEEGAIAYELQAQSLITHADDICQVSVLPPVSCSQLEMKAL